MFWTVGVAAICVESLWWPRIHDSSLMEYIAWNLHHGAQPYKQVFDMNLPGTYLYHLLGQIVLGSGDVHVRIYDLATDGLLAWALWRLLRPFSVRTRWLAILLMLTIHLGVGGPFDELERDWVVAVFVVLAVALLFETRRRALCQLVAGLALGWAVMIKPQALLAVVAVPYFLALASGMVPPYRELRARWREVLRAVWRPTLLVGVSAAAVIGALLAWVKVAGDWSQFNFIVRDYLPTFSRLNSDGFEQGSTTLHALFKTLERLPKSMLGPSNLIPLVGLAGVVWRRRDPERQARMDALALVAVIGAVHAISEFKLYRYHWSVFQVAGVAMLAVMVVELASSVDRPQLGLARSTLGTWTYRGAIAASVIAGIMLIGLSTFARWDTSPSVAQKHDRSVQVADVLRSRARPGDRVQVLDHTGGGLDAAERAGLKPGTRFIYDIHFFHDQGTAINRKLRREYVSDFEHNRPRFVVVYRQSWGHRMSYQALDQFPQLVDLLRPYRIVWHDSEVRVLERTTASGPTG